MGWTEADYKEIQLRRMTTIQREEVVKSERAAVIEILENEIEKDIENFLRFSQITYTLTKSEIGRNKGKGIEEGWPDITGCYQGFFLGIEVKAETGTLRAKQAIVLSNLWKDGALIVIARCVEEVRDLIKTRKTPQATVNEIVAKLNQRAK